MAIKLDEARVRLLKIGTSLMLKSDNEGGNLRLYAPNSSTNCYEWDVYDGNLRLYYSTTNGDNATASWHFKTNGELHSALIRSDNCLQVGDSGSAFLARSDGYGKFSTRLDIGSKLSLWQDDEGGNIQIASGTDHTNAWQIDNYNGNLRFFTYRESDGAF